VRRGDRVDGRPIDVCVSKPQLLRTAEDRIGFKKEKVFSAEEEVRGVISALRGCLDVPYVSPGALRIRTHAPARPALKSTTSLERPVLLSALVSPSSVPFRLALAPQRGCTPDPGPFVSHLLAPAHTASQTHTHPPLPSPTPPPRPIPPSPHPPSPRPRSKTQTKHEAFLLAGRRRRHRRRGTRRGRGGEDPRGPREPDQTGTSLE
jgi:hypothetical protein